MWAGENTVPIYYDILMNGHTEKTWCHTKTQVQHRWKKGMGIHKQQSTSPCAYVVWQNRNEGNTLFWVAEGGAKQNRMTFSRRYVPSPLASYQWLIMFLSSCVCKRETLLKTPSRVSLCCKWSTKQVFVKCVVGLSLMHMVTITSREYCPCLGTW